MILGKQEERQKFMSDYSNPFTSEKITNISFDIRKETSFMYPQLCKATVWFKSGDTSGHHDIVADDFAALCYKVQDFIESL